MARTSDIRIAGVSLPDKHVVISLTYVYGIGRSRSEEICEKLKIQPDAKLSTLSDKEIESLRSAVNDYKVEGDLRREVGMSIKNLMDKKCYRGFRHRRNLPLRGQRTKTNARTRKGRKK